MYCMSPQLLSKFDLPGPRYTSYPTADRFVEAFTALEYAQSLTQRVDMHQRMGAPLSLYVHVPFCESVCYFCACNTVITKHHEKGQKYLGYLAREVKLLVGHLGTGQAVSQLHLGGGTPTFLSDRELQDLMAVLRSNFDFMPGGDYSIEVDPRTVDTQRLAGLAALGFTRLSFGIQDFDYTVQKAVNRIQSADSVSSLIQSARQLGFASINVDLIYGLPNQTPESFMRTLAQVTRLRPDRVALYAYAYLPERFKPQRRILSEQLPTAAVKTQLLAQSLVAFETAGYEYIGMEHFALPSDALAVAKRQGRLHGNFQGYSTQPDCDLIALGVSAIGKIGSSYAQNSKILEEYYDLLDQGLLPVVRGLVLSRDDVIRRSVIMSIMCRGQLEFESFEQAFQLDFLQYFGVEMQALAQLQLEGLLHLTRAGLQVTADGWFFVHAVAMVFDKYLQADRNRAQFSRIL